MSTRLYTQTQGTGPDLILIHGWAIHSGIWQSLLPELTKHFRVTVVDLPGFGQSELLENDYNLLNIVDRIIREVPSPAYWLGWSLGGQVTLTAAIHYPERVLKAIIVTSSPKFIGNKTWPGLSWSILQQFAQNLAFDYETTFARFITSQLLHSEHLHEVKNIIQAALQQRAPSLKALMKGFKIIRETDLRPELIKITCPTLYIYGRSDALVPIAVAGEIAKLHPGAAIEIIKRAGHAPFLSHPEEFMTLVINHCGHG